MENKLPLQFSPLNFADNQELLAGNHTFNFHFTLPQTIPSSLNHHYGKVLYQISVDIEQQLKFNYSFNFPFNVIGSLDLNHEGVEIRRPLRGDISKKFFLGFSTGALQISAQIPFCGFSGGQTLSIDVEIVNDSKINVERIFVELRQHLLFKCDFVSTRTDSKLLIQGSHDGVAASSKGQMSFLFQVPPVSPTSMKTCKYIHISYEAVIVAKFGGIHRSLELILPIVIGTIPLNRSSDLSENSPCLKEPSNENEKKD